MRTRTGFSRRYRARWSASRAGAPTGRPSASARCSETTRRRRHPAARRRRRRRRLRARPRRRVARRGSSRGSRDPRRGTIRARETRAMRRRVDDGRGALRRVARAPARRPHRVHASRGRRAGGARGPAMAPRGRGRRRIRRRRRGRRERPQEDGRRASAHRARGRANGRLVDAPRRPPPHRVESIGEKRQPPEIARRRAPSSASRGAEPGAFASAIAIVANAVGGTGDLRALQLYHAPYGRSNPRPRRRRPPTPSRSRWSPATPRATRGAKADLTYRAGPTHEFSVKRLWPPGDRHGGGRRGESVDAFMRKAWAAHVRVGSGGVGVASRTTDVVFTTTTRRS